MLGLHQSEYRDNLDRARSSREQYEQYRDRVSDYIREVEEVCAEAHMARPGVESRLNALQKQLPSMPASEKEGAQSEVDSLKNWLNAEATLSSDAGRNIDLCQRWLAHCKDLSNIDSYNASREEQAIEDEQRKMDQARQMLASEQRKAQERAYWDAMNGVNGYGGGYYYGGYIGGRGGRRLSYSGHHVSVGPVAHAPISVSHFSTGGHHR